MRRWLPRWLAPVLLLLAPGGLHAQWAVDFRRPTATIGAAFDGTWLSQGGDVSVGQVREWARVALGAAVRRDGRRTLAQIRAAIAPQIGQTWANLNNGGGTLNPNGLAGNATLALSPTRNVSTTGGLLASNRFQPDVYGGYQQFDSREWRAELRDGNPLLPITLSFSDREETTVIASGVSQAVLNLDRRVREFRYQATNWKTLLMFHQREVDELAGARERSYLQRTGRASNTLRWGKGSQFRNQLSYFAREREGDSHSLSLTSTAHLQQTERISTGLLGARGWSAGEGWRGTSDDLRAEIRYRTPGGAYARVEVARRRERVAEYSRSDISVAPQVNFTHAFSPRISFETNLLVGHTWTQRDQGAGTFVYVLDERHIFGPDGQIRLERPFADATSLVLVTSDGTQLDEGFDYRVQEEPPYLVVVLLPGGRIQVGSEVVADYRYQVPAQSAMRYLSVRGSATLRMGGLALLYRRDLREDGGDPPLGDVPSLLNVDNQAVGLQYNLSRGRVAVSAYTGAEWFDSDEFRATRWSMNLSLAAALTQTTGVSIGGRSSRNARGSEFSNAEARTGLTWRPLAGLRSEVFASLFTWEDQVRSERTTSVGSNVQFQRGGTRVSLRVDLIQRRAASDRTRQRIALRFEQAFR